MHEAEVMVIGGGMVGAACAYGLARRGIRVIVIDGGDLDFRAARGNGGLVWVQGKGLDMAAYQHLTRRSSDSWPDFARELTSLDGTDIQYQRKGGVTLCLGDEELASREGALMRLHNQPGGSARDFEMLDRRRLGELMPGVPFGPEVAGASYCWRDGHVDPLRLLLAMQRGFQKLGGRLVSQQPVHSLTHMAGVFHAKTRTDTYTAPKVLIAAGNGSGPLARQVGLDVPVRPQRGQMMVTERFPAILPLPAGGIRQTGDGTFQIGATQEEVGFDIGTTVEAAATMARRAVRVLPMLKDAKVVRQWAALRVMTPDGHPIYAQSEIHPGAFVALCHSGVTLAAVHCEMLSAAVVAGALRKTRPHSTIGASMFRKQHEPTASVRIVIDGVTVPAEPDETVAAVLLRTPPFFARTTALTGEPRAPYCMMGVCFDCLAVVDGVASTQTCLTLVRDGMRVERQRHTGRPTA